MYPDGKDGCADGALQFCLNGMPSLSNVDLAIFAGQVFLKQGHP
jgi:hypothetical protein